MTERQPQPGSQHPEEYRNDLNPHANDGKNYGMSNDQQAARDARTAYDVKEVHNMLDKLTDENLRSIPILPAGTRLAQGAVYIDLHDPQRKEFKALGNMEAGPDNWYVPKSEVDYQLWNELIGVTDAPRLGEDDEV